MINSERGVERLLVQGGRIWMGEKKGAGSSSRSFRFSEDASGYRSMFLVQTMFISFQTSLQLLPGGLLFYR